MVCSPVLAATQLPFPPPLLAGVGLVLAFVAGVFLTLALHPSGGVQVGPAPASVSPPEVLTPVPVDPGFSFFREPFIHPLAIKDLSGWVSGVGGHVVAVDLTETDGGYRFSDDFEISRSQGACPTIRWYDTEAAERRPVYFDYRYIGMTDSRVHVLLTHDSGGGSGVWVQVQFFVLQSGVGLAAGNTFGPPRVVLSSIGQVSLHDRWAGEVEVHGDEVFIGRNEGWFGEQYPGRERRFRVATFFEDPLPLPGFAAACS